MSGCHERLKRDRIKVFRTIVENDALMVTQLENPLCSVAQSVGALILQTIPNIGIRPEFRIWGQAQAEQFDLELSGILHAVGFLIKQYKQRNNRHL